MKRCGWAVGAACACGWMLLARPALAGTLVWGGSVDDTATIYLTGQRVRVTANRKGVKEERERIEGRLPRRPVHLAIMEIRGRGDVELVQAPNKGNGFTAAVRITDKQGGADRYRFTLRWSEARGTQGVKPRRR